MALETQIAKLAEQEALIAEEQAKLVAMRADEDALQTEIHGMEDQSALLPQRLAETNSRGKIGEAAPAPPMSEEDHAADCFGRALSAVQGFNGLANSKVQFMVVEFITR